MRGGGSIDSRETRPYACVRSKLGDFAGERTSREQDMTRSRITLIGALSALLLALGCGKGDESTTRFNTVLGGSAAPTSGTVDKGILGDPSAYKPAVASANLGAGGGGAPTGANAVADSPEAQAVKRSMSILVDDLTAMSASGILSAFDPAKTESLRKADFESALTNLLSAIENTQRVIRAKAAPDQQATLDGMVQMLPEVIRLFTSNTRVTMDADGQTAQLFLDPPTEAAIDEFLKQHGDRLVESAKSALKNAPPGSIPPQVAAMADTLTIDTLKEMVGALKRARELARKAIAERNGIDASAPQPTAGIPFRKTGDRWTIELPFSINDELADALKEGATLAQEALSNLASAVDAAPSLDDPSISAALLPAMGPLMEWSNRISRLFGEALGSPASAPSASEPAPAQPTDAPAPAGPRSPRQPINP